MSGVSYKPPYEILGTYNPLYWRTGRADSTATSSSTSLSNDAFGRLRTSGVGNRFDVEFTYDKQPLIMEEVISGNSTITWNSLYRDVRLGVNETANGTSAILCSGYNPPYTPGCSQVIEMTGVMDLTGIGGGTMSIFHKFAGNTTIYTQNTWTSSSNAETCDWKYSHIFGIDFQSLKVGTARFFLVRNGEPKLVHQINNDNKRNSGYWQHPNMRAYWRIYNTANATISEVGYGGVNNGLGYRYTLPSANSTATMSAICATAKSEGGPSLFDLPGYSFATSNYLTSKTIADTLIPILSIKVQPTYNSCLNRTLVILEELSIVNDNPLLVRLYLNPTLTNASFSAIDANSVISRDVSASAITGGTIVYEDYAFNGLTKSATTRALLSRVILGNNWSGTDADIVSVAGVRTTNSSATTFARLQWREVR